MDSAGTRARPGAPLNARRGPKRVRRALKVTAIAAAALVATSLATAAILGAVSGCGSVDPTDPANYSTATRRPITLRPFD